MIEIEKKGNNRMKRNMDERNKMSNRKEKMEPWTQVK